QEVHDSKVKDTSFYDSMQLPWAGWAFTARDVPANINLFVDLVRVRKDSSGWDFSFEKSLSTNEKLKGHRGTYRFTFVATADNAAPAYCSVDVKYEGDWNRLRAWKMI